MGAADFLAALDPRPDTCFVIETYTDGPKGTSKALSDPLSGQWSGLTKAEVLALVPELIAKCLVGRSVQMQRCKGKSFIQ